MTSAANYDQFKAQFETVAGRPPTVEETEGLLRLKESLGLRWDDPIFSLLMAFDNYKSFFIEIPEHVKKGADFIISEAQRQLGDEVKKSVTQVAQVHVLHSEKLDKVGNKVRDDIVTESISALRGSIRETVTVEVRGIQGEGKKAVDAIRAAATNAASECRAVVAASRRQWVWALAQSLLVGVVASLGTFGVIQYVNDRGDKAGAVSDADRANLAIGTRLSERWETLSPSTKREIEKIMKE